MEVVAPEVLAETAHGLAEIFPDTTCEVIGDVLAVPEHAFDKKRSQYNSTMILNDVQSFAAHRLEYNRVLGIVDVDIYSSGLNYVFGEAYLPERQG